MASPLHGRADATTGAFPIVSMLLSASSHAERARILLRTSDAALLPYPMFLQEACEHVGFVEGQVFVALRCALLHRTRDEHGLLPEREAAELEQLRQALSHIAAGVEHG